MWTGIEQLLGDFVLASPPMTRWVWANMLLYMLFLLGYLLTFSLLPSVLLTKKRQPTSTVAWVLVIILLPYLGGLLYLVFGVNRVARRTARKLHARHAIRRQLKLAESRLPPAAALNQGLLAPMIRLTSRLGETHPTPFNQIDIQRETPETFRWISEAVAAAQHSIHLEYYIWQPDETGTALRDLLIERARAGLKIRFLYDVLGSMRLTRQFLKPMQAAGIQVAPFLPGKTFLERWSINLRSHRKIIVVDGKIGFTGGMNIGNEYLGKVEQFGYWRDTHLRMRGPSVSQLQQVFVEDWYYATGEELTAPELFPELIEAGEHFAQVVASGPYSDVETLHTVFFAALNEARTRITLATSYFVPTPPLIAALEAAAFRGVQVRLLLAGTSAHYATLLAARSYYDSLLACGVEIYEYTEGLLHSKTLCIDDQWAFVGTPNFDARSLLLNFEVGVCLYGAEHVRLLESHFRTDLEMSRRITREEWQTRSRFLIMAENLCRMFSPVL